MHTFVIIPKPIWEWCYRLMDFSVVLSLFESCGLELDVEAEVELDGIGVASYETWLSTFFSDLSI